MQRRFILFLAAAGVFIPALLLADTRGLVPQFVLGLATLTFLAVFARGSEVETRQIVCAIVVATTGEIVLSLGWGLYTYRHALIPLYVPFGHGLFYALAAESAQQPTLRRYARPITRAVLIGGSIIAGVSFIFFHDPWGLLWWIAAGILVMRSRNQLLLSACFTYTIILEWLGTAIGNWHWANVVPFVGLRSANPPSGVGILYILLDLITVAICSGMPTVVLSEALVPRGSHMGRWRNSFCATAAIVPVASKMIARELVVPGRAQGWLSRVNDRLRAPGHDQHSRRIFLKRTLVEIPPQRLDLQPRDPNAIDLLAGPGANQ